MGVRDGRFEVLASARSGVNHATVGRTVDGDLVLTIARPSRALSDDSYVELSYDQRFTFIGAVSRGFTGMGGMLPPSAVTVSVTDAEDTVQSATVANGAWALVLASVDDRNFDPVLEFCGSDGQVVERRERRPSFAETVAHHFGPEAASAWQLASAKEPRPAEPAGADDARRLLLATTVLDESEVRAVIAAQGLERVADDIVAEVRAGYRLDLDVDADPAMPGVSKIGGEPDLAPGETWPHSRTGARMVFLAQVDLAALAPLPTHWRAGAALPAGPGLLRVFANLLEHVGMPAAARLLITTANPGVFVRTPAPVIPLPLEPGAPYESAETVEVDEDLPECVIRPVPFLTLPPTLDIIDELSADGERYAAVIAQLRANSTAPPRPWHEVFTGQLLGEPGMIQTDPRETGAHIAARDPWMAQVAEIDPDPDLGDPQAWSTLLSLHHDERMQLYIGDGGAYEVLIPTHDLRAGRLDRAICDQQES